MHFKNNALDDLCGTVLSLGTLCTWGISAPTNPHPPPLHHPLLNLFIFYLGSFSIYLAIFLPGDWHLPPSPHTEIAFYQAIALGPQQTPVWLWQKEARGGTYLLGDWLWEKKEGRLSYHALKAWGVVEFPEKATLVGILCLGDLCPMGSDRALSAFSLS